MHVRFPCMKCVGEQAALLLQSSPVLHFLLQLGGGTTIHSTIAAYSVSRPLFRLQQRAVGGRRASGNISCSRHDLVEL
jgi:hypothetical protein